MPSFSRQTGQSCNACHTQSFGPNLTPFGREFKLGDYAMSGGSGTAAKLPPLSGMVQGSQVGGATAYTMINNLLYLEAGAYGSFSSNFQNAFGIAGPDRVSLDGAAPYWRAALQHTWQGNYFSLGHYGMSADVYPGRDKTYGANHYTDAAVDATYQYMANPKHIFEAKTSYIYEDQNLSADRGAASDPTTGRTYLSTYNLNLAYTYDQTYGLTFAYKKINGSHAAQFDEMGGIVAQTRPNSQYYTAELVYVPFGKSNSYSYLMNLRTSLQYIGYSQANGTNTDAQYNNTFMVNGWLAF